MYFISSDLHVVTFSKYKSITKVRIERGSVWVLLIANWAFISAISSLG